MPAHNTRFRTKAEILVLIANELKDYMASYEIDPHATNAQRSQFIDRVSALFELGNNAPMDTEEDNDFVNNYHQWFENAKNKSQLLEIDLYQIAGQIVQQVTELRSLDQTRMHINSLIEIINSTKEALSDIKNNFLRKRQIIMHKKESLKLFWQAMEAFSQFEQDNNIASAEPQGLLLPLQQADIEIHPTNIDDDDDADGDYHSFDDDDSEDDFESIYEAVMEDGSQCLQLLQLLKSAKDYTEIDRLIAENPDTWQLIVSDVVQTNDQQRANSPRCVA